MSNGNQCLGVVRRITEDPPVLDKKEELGPGINNDGPGSRPQAVIWMVHPGRLAWSRFGKKGDMVKLVSIPATGDFPFSRD